MRDLEESVELAREQLIMERKAMALLACLPENIHSEEVSMEDFILDALRTEGLLTCRSTEHNEWYRTTGKGRQWLLDFVRGNR